MLTSFTLAAIALASSADAIAIKPWGVTTGSPPDRRSPWGVTTGSPPTPPDKRSPWGVTTGSPSAVQDKPTRNYAQLKRHNGRLSARSPSTSTTPQSPRGLDELENVQVTYLIPVTIGSQTFDLILDTGSSDTWVAADNFKCVDAKGQPVSQATCNFGPTFKGAVADKSSDLLFNSSYGGGEELLGDVGFEDVTIAGITVPKHEVSLVTTANWNGDGKISGIAGFAFPDGTSVFHQNHTAAHYDGIFTHMWKAGLSAPYFTLALQRGDQGGYVAIGGLPPIKISSVFTSTPIVPTNFGGKNFTALQNYVTVPDGFVIAGNDGGSRSIIKNSDQWIVDSGTTVINLPSNMTTQLNNFFEPKAQMQTNGTWLVDCNAKAPQFGVTVGGQTLYADHRDLIRTFKPDPATGLCLSAFQTGRPGGYILGDAWLKSVVAVHDVGAMEMRFAAHSY